MAVCLRLFMIFLDKNGLVFGLDDSHQSLYLVKSCFLGFILIELR